MNYRRLILCRIEHNYYPDCRGEGFVVQIPDSTYSLMKNAKLLFKNENNEFSIFYDDDSKEILDAYLNDENSGAQMVFSLHHTDAQFFNFTNIPFSQNKFGKFSLDADNVEENIFLLNKKSFVSGEDLYELEKLEFKPSFRKLFENHIGFIVFPFSVLKLILKQENGYNAINSLLRFDSRKTYWNYLVVSRNGRLEKNIRIKDVSGNCKFSEPRELNITDGRSALSIESSEELPFQKLSNFNFQLVQEKQGDEIIIIKRLPVASSAQLKINNVNNQERSFSNIYIYN